MTATRIHSRFTSARAFTLIEVLVASSVMVILVGIVAYIAGSVMDSWNRSSGKLSANAEARLVLDVVARDLETAVLRNNGMQWLRIEGPAGLAADAPYDTSGSVVLKLFTPVLDRQGDDGLCAVAYKLEYKSTYTGGPLTYALYRRVVNSEDTLTDYLSSGYEDPTDGATVQGSLGGDGIGAADWSAATITNDVNYLAGNIVEFKVLIYDSSQTQPRNGDANNAVDDDYIFGGTDSNAGTNIPLYADIILTVMTDQGIQLLNNIAQNLVTDDPDAVVTQNSETLIRRVYFQSNSI